MELIFVILPLALIIAGVSVAAFLWAARTDQFSDLDTPAIRMLQEGEGIRQRDHQANTRSQWASKATSRPPDSLSQP